MEKRVEEMTDAEVIQELNASGIQVITKHIALMPDMIGYMFNDRIEPTVETDIHQALRQIRRRKPITAALDPFKD